MEFEYEIVTRVLHEVNSSFKYTHSLALPAFITNYLLLRISHIHPLASPLCGYARGFIDLKLSSDIGWAEVRWMCNTSGSAIQKNTNSGTLLLQRRAPHLHRQHPHHQREVSSVLF